MGWFKSITKAVSKAVNKVTKEVSRPVKQAVSVVSYAAGNKQSSEAQGVETAANEAAVAPAQAVDTPDSVVDTEDDSTSESSKRKLASKGKRSLSIARSSGTGINI